MPRPARPFRLKTARVALAALALTVLTPGISAAEGSAERGAYLVNIMHCNGCHTPRGPDGIHVMERFLGGGTVGFRMAGLGIFWPPNLTPDATGLAGWSDAEIVRAVREGVSRDGRLLAPIMPANDYAPLSDADAADMVAYLRSLPPVAHAVPEPMGLDAVPPGPYFDLVVPQ